MVHGIADYVIVKGRICVEEGEIKATLSRGWGDFVQTPVFPAIAYPDAAPIKTENKVSILFSSFNLFNVL